MLGRPSTGFARLTANILLLGCIAIDATVSVARAASPAEKHFAEPAKAVSSEKGAQLFAARCSSCHDHARGNIPPTAILEQKSPEVVIAALTTGPMRTVAAGLRADEIEAVALFVTGKPLGLDALPTANLCQHKPGPVRFGTS